MGDLCGNFTIVINSTLSMTFEDLQKNGVQTFPGIIFSYLRPSGFALLPWIYTVIVLTVHIPTVIIRVLKWETTQLWCLACTFLTVVVYIQGDVSTGFSPETILVWTPLLLLIDAGSMSQIIFLTADENALFFLIRIEWIKFKGWLMRRSSQEIEEAKSKAKSAAEEGRNDGREKRNSKELDAQKSIEDALKKPIYQEFSFYVAAIALLLFIAIFVLQVLGLIHACANIGVVPKVQWCSPIFQPFGVAVIDGDCNVYPIDQSYNKGIGCIYLPGIQQQGWLTGTAAGTIISLVLETIDLLVLIFVNSSKKSRGVKMRRPWFTMFCGLAVLGVMLVFGIIYTQDLPPGITSKIWVVVNTGRPSIYEVSLSPAGLRGAIIGWNDGLFESWNQTYFGTWYV